MYYAHANHTIQGTYSLLKGWISPTKGSAVKFSPLDSWLNITLDVV